ncbi:S-layer homology domain-containing protein [Paenibacillus shenyangensis]|uniref:S-layer homology domain-containing protein n=1 Tax=Paenibacillus sp. A9 TaxID=1284352 RepID=UPI00036B135C|nr:S-layer homology domain-containing protein [Paenibacillus sp. A9]
MWNSKKKAAALLALSCALAGSGVAAAAAFSDVQGSNNQSIVSSLQEKGIINGVTATQFKPNQQLTQPQAIQMLVNAFDMKGPETASGQVWYTQAVAAARANGLSIPANLKASEPVTREQFAIWLHQAIDKTGQYPATMMMVVFQDQKSISKEASNAIQNLVNMNVIPRSSVGQEFKPKAAITRMDAATWVYSAVEMVERHKQLQSGDDTSTSPQPSEGEQMGTTPEMGISSTADGKQKVTLHVELPNPGYNLKIDNVKLTDDKRAIISYSLQQPEPGMMYPQVITEGTAATIIPAGYTPELAK